jgi:hypothetical protein
VDVTGIEPVTLCLQSRLLLESAKVLLPKNREQLLDTVVEERLEPLTSCRQKLPLESKRELPCCRPPVR